MSERLREIFAEVFELDQEKVVSGLGRNNVDGWDPLNHFRFVTAIEAEFEISLTMDEVQSIDCFSVVESLVERKTQSR